MQKHKKWQKVTKLKTVKSIKCKSGNIKNDKKWQKCDHEKWHKKWSENGQKMTSKSDTKSDQNLTSKSDMKNDHKMRC